MGESYLGSESGSDSDDDVPIKRQMRSPRRKDDIKMLKKQRSNLRDDDNSDVEIVTEKKQNKNKGKGSRKKAGHEDDIELPKKLTETNQKSSYEKTGAKGKAKAMNGVASDNKHHMRVNRPRQTEESLRIDDQVSSSSSDDVKIQIERPKVSGSKKNNEIVYLDDDKDGSTEEGFSKSDESKTKVENKYFNKKHIEKQSSADNKRKKIRENNQTHKKRRKVLQDSEESADELNLIKRSNSSAPGSSQQPNDEHVCFRGSKNLAIHKQKKMVPIDEIDSKHKKKMAVDCDDDDEIDYEQNRSLEAISLHCSQKHQNMNKSIEIIELEKEEKEIKEKKKTPEEILKSCKIKKLNKEKQKESPIEQIIEKQQDPIVQGRDHKNKNNLNQTSIRSTVASGSKPFLPVAHPTRPYTNPASNPNQFKNTSSNRSVRNLSTRADPDWCSQI
ncbi:uncharacterized protein MELLADRAFT_103101 [Melampsora larici-populina 98AG31]|uniref:Uncharacterized protein n=1 Tax=Melampsora larici-populina (strain 98AG31 / pathotype 3-4-7) TaxID=747676 RepID=F4RAJ7_MELLP|nr:uncharacterized protein MELLADRAFT_103101 [Melampsora larici-populina 98AG31]EGG10493.1 hypothetical protein MELLADRAFT_103101 [Melampsora larici-populina 98AG31]